MTRERLLIVMLLPVGDCIVQNGANSAVGRFVIQLAAMRGIATINIVRNRPNFDELKADLVSLGATKVFHDEEILLNDAALVASVREQGGLRPKLAFNCVGGMAVRLLAAFLEPGSTIVTYGAMGGKPMTVSVGDLIFKDLRFVGFWLTNWYQKCAQDEQLRNKKDFMMKDILKMYSNGAIRLPSLKSFDFLTQWKDAIDYYSVGDSIPLTEKRKPQLIFNASTH